MEPQRNYMIEEYIQQMLWCVVVMLRLRHHHHISLSLLQTKKLSLLHTLFARGRILYSYANFNPLGGPNFFISGGLRSAQEPQKSPP